MKQMAFKNLNEFLEHLKNLSTESILDFEQTCRDYVEIKGWEIETFDQFIKDTKEDDVEAQKLRKQDEIIQRKNNLIEKLEGLKNITNPEKIEEEIKNIKETLAGATLTNTADAKDIKIYSWTDYIKETKEYNPEKYFCPELFYKLPFPDGTLSIIGARTGRGKTTSLINITSEALSAKNNNKRKVIFITLEMSARQLFNKLILQRVYAGSDGETRRTILNETIKVPSPTGELFKILSADETHQFTGINTQFLSKVKDEQKFVSSKSDMGDFQMIDGRRLTQKQITDFISCQEKGTLILIDYIQRMPVSNTRVHDRYLQVKEISDALVNVTIKSGVVTICAAQLNRVAGTDRDGNDTFDDTSFRESGDIEQDAHNAVAIGWKSNKKDRFYKVLKSRESGQASESFNLIFEGAYSFMKRDERFVESEETTKQNEGYGHAYKREKPGSNPRRIG
jgi:replicative DNA helicase